MINNDYKTSLLVPSQLPGFIRDNSDYANFVSFIQAYYEWTELSNTSNSLVTTSNSYNQGVTFGSKNISTYWDIDSTIDDFVQYFINDFLPYFPADALTDQRTAIKYARELYQTKGTPASFKFLFQILYGSTFDYFNTGDAVLKASAGIWYVSKSLQLATDDPRFLEIANYRAFGKTSKSFATIENTVFSKNKTEIFISNIERLFESGETIVIVDNNNQEVLINDANLTAILVGQINQINISPNNRGLFYKPGDPVVVYNGLNPNILNPIGATAEVGTTTSGSVQRVNVNNGGYGYTFANTLIEFNNLNADAATPIAVVGSVSANGVANVNFIGSDQIGHAAVTDIQLGNTFSFFPANTSANIHSTLANAFTFLSFSTYPISSVLVENHGGNIITQPTVYADSLYQTTIPGVYGHLQSLGILAPIQITTNTISGVVTGAGHSYQANDTIIFTGGSGYGAYANVTSVNANGSILSVSYVKDPKNQIIFPYGGMGYLADDLPSVSVNSANGVGASLYVPGILGDGATFSASVDRAGSITTINITDYGEDYISAPNVSLKVMDIVVTGISPAQKPTLLQKIYQGANVNSATFLATVDTASVINPNANTQLSTWNLRVFNYNSTPNVSLPLLIQNTNDVLYPKSYTIYGDGTALATSSFLNGLRIGQGQYLNSSGQPSSYDVIQSTEYNNYTYQITVEKEIAKYRDVVKNLLHPAGMNLIGRYAIKSNNLFNFYATNEINSALPLVDYTQNTSTYAYMTTDFTNTATNIVTFENLGTANLANIFTTNTTISLTPPNGPNVFSKIVSANTVSNTITLETNTFLTYLGVATASVVANTTTINITSLTGAYDIMVNGYYLDPANALGEIVYAGDTVLLDDYTTYLVTSVNPLSNTIIVSSNIQSNLEMTYVSVARNYFVNGNTGILVYNPE